jgi:hypothetical protein
MKKNNKIKKHQISENISNSQYNEAILWLLTIPNEELSDSMLLAHKQMKAFGQNEIWLIDYFENNLKEEIEEFIEWNDTFLETKAV